MARVALLVGVSAEQREPREPVIEENLVGPGVLVVTIEAGGTLRAVVGVVFFVAVDALRQRFDLEDRLDVTGLAFEQFVGTVQRVLRVDIMVELHGGPRCGGVAGVAGDPEMTLVVVVLEMAGDTGDIVFVVEWIFAVAVTAAQFGVPAVQRETCVARMVELRVVPTRRRVAVATFVSAAAIVRIVFGMAVEALRRRRLERLILVATRAFGFRVLADQRKAGRVVIELDVGPRDGGMAVRAFRPHRVAMYVVCLVAGEAV